MHSFKNPVLVHENDADGRDVYFYLGNDIHIGRETLGVAAQTWTADMEDALVDVVKAELSIEQLGAVAGAFAAGVSRASGTGAVGAAAARVAEGTRAALADHGKPVAIAPLKYSGHDKERRGAHFDPSGYTVIAGLNLTGYATLGFSWQGRKVAKEVLLRPATGSKQQVGVTGERRRVQPSLHPAAPVASSGLVCIKRGTGGSVRRTSAWKRSKKCTARFSCARLASFERTEFAPGCTWGPGPGYAQDFYREWPVAPKKYWRCPYAHVTVPFSCQPKARRSLRTSAKT